MTADETITSYPLSSRNRVKRRHDRGFYDHDTVHGLLDASMLCHVSYVIDGQPYCTPTFFWREETTLYWHGSSASRMLRNQSGDQRVCLTVAHLDSLVLARCGFNHSADYRAVMAFGRAYLVTEPEAKERALVAMVDRFFPGRTASLRQSTAQEIKATSGYRDGDRSRLLPRFAPKASPTMRRTTNYLFMPSESRSARCSVRRSHVRGCATASNVRHRCADMRKAARSKRRWPRRIFCNIPANEMRLRCTPS